MEVSRWELNGDATDSAGDNDGTLQGAPAFGPSLVSSEPAGQAVDLDGSSQYVQVANAPSLQITGSYWFSVWMERGTTVGEQILLRKGGDFRLYMNAGSGLGLEHETSGGVEYECQTGTDILAGRIYRIDGVFDAAAKEMRLYVNGRKVKTLTAVNAGPKSSTSALFLGSQSGTSRFWKGRLDKVIVRNSAGSDAEVLAAYREESLEVFADSFESGSTSAWATKQEVAGALSVVSAEPIAGAFSLKALVEGGGTRAELIPGHVDFFAGDDIYARLKFRVPEGFSSTGWGTLIFQLRDEGDNSPTVAAYIIGGYLYVKGGPATGLAETVYWKGPLVSAGSVYDLVVRVTLSEDPAAGKVQVWLDSVKQEMLASTGRTAIGRSYPKFGLYRDSSIADAGHVFLDSIAITRSAPFAAPDVITAPATAISPVKATLNGTVDPNGLATTYYFEYGTTEAYGEQTEPIELDPVEEPVPVSAPVSGLKPKTDHHYRLVASNAEGETAGEDQAFTTAVGPHPMFVREPVPMRTSLLCTSPSGKTYRWSEDDSTGARVLAELDDSGSVPGGPKDLTASLIRKPGVDYGDMKRGSRIEVRGAGQKVLREYRLEREPQVSGDTVAIDPAAAGYHSTLGDNSSAQEIFIDAEISAWGETSARRRVEVDVLKYTNSQRQVLPAGTPDPENPSSPLRVPAISHSWTEINNNGGANPDVAESWYDSLGIPIGALLLDFARIKGIGAGDGSWNNEVWTSEDGVTLLETLADFNATSAEYVRLEVPAANRFFLMLRDYYSPGLNATGNWEVHWKNMRVLGRHDLPVYGTWPDVGLLASDVVAYVLARWVPGIQFSTGRHGTIKPTQFLLPHLVFKEPTTAAEMIQQALRFELPEHGVWPGQFGPTFYMNPRGEREGSMRWRARASQVQFEDAGQQMDKVFNGVVVQGQATDGSTIFVGPPGSGLRYISERCIDRDPQNPVNELGEKRYAKIQMKGVATFEGMEEAAEIFLEEAKLLDGSGKATLTGYVEDEHGRRWPYDYVEAGDLIELLGSSIPGYRYIVNASRSRSKREVAIDIDAPPDGFESMLERLYAKYVGLALAG